MNRNSILEIGCLNFDLNQFDDNPLNLNDKSYDPKFVKNYILKLQRNEIPFKIKNLSIFQDKSDSKILEFKNAKNLNNFSERILRHLFNFDNFEITNNLSGNKQDNKDKHENHSTKIYISASLDNTFSGNVLQHNQIEMTIDEYIGYKGEINLYLSQINLLKDPLTKIKLKEILNYSKLENLIDQEFSRINIWHSYKNTLSKFHYDSYENFLLLCKGKKIFTIAPNDSKIIKSNKIGENSGNQFERIIFKRNSEKLRKLKKEFKDKSENLSKNFSLSNKNENNLKQIVDDYINLIKRASKYFLLQIESNENEMIYLPEGWWHQVETFGVDNLAFNFWWDKSNNLLNNNKEMFLIKQSINKLVEKKIKRIYRQNFKKKEFKKFRINRLKRLIEIDKNAGQKLIKILFKEKSFNFDTESNEYICEQDKFLEYDLISMCVIYSEFEKQKNSEENKIFFEKFWSLIEDKNLTSRFMQKINEMKHKVSLKVLEDIKKCI